MDIYREVHSQVMYSQSEAQHKGMNQEEMPRDLNTCENRLKHPQNASPEMASLCVSFSRSLLVPTPFSWLSISYFLRIFPW